MEPTRGYENQPAVTRIELPPIAGPSILGFFGFAAATFLVGAHLADWYGNAATPHYIFPFAMMCGGLAQILAAMWAFRARSPVGTAMHGIWGSFYLAYGILYMFVYAGFLHVATAQARVDLGYWFAVLAAITWACVIGALAKNFATVSTLTVLSCAATLECIALFLNSGVLSTISGYIFVASAVLAFYTATAEMVAEAFGREVVPLIATRRARRHESVTYRET
jgi:succinate-acetate transporter protein